MYLIGFANLLCKTRDVRNFAFAKCNTRITNPFSTPLCESALRDSCGVQNVISESSLGSARCPNPLCKIRSVRIRFAKYEMEKRPSRPRQLHILYKRRQHHLSATACMPFPHTKLNFWLTPSRPQYSTLDYSYYGTLFISAPC